MKIFESPIAKHAVVAQRSGGLHLVSHHATEREAHAALAQTTDKDPLSVVPAVVSLASNGNVRLWFVPRTAVH